MPGHVLARAGDHMLHSGIQLEGLKSRALDVPCPNLVQMENLIPPAPKNAYILLEVCNTKP